LLLAAIATHETKLGRTPHLVAADAAFYSGKNEAAAKAKGVKRVCIPNRTSKSAASKCEQKKRWFRNGQKWRTGCEGRISVIKRRHGLARSRYQGDDGMKRWVGLGVIADNLVNLGRALAKPPDAKLRHAGNTAPARRRSRRQNSDEDARALTAVLRGSQRRKLG
jgi:IS5 family transposase